MGDSRIRVYTPKVFEDSTAIAKAILSGTCVMINTRDMNTQESQRMIDFLTGVTYTVDGSIQKVGHQLLMIAPPAWAVEGKIEVQQ